MTGQLRTSLHEHADSLESLHLDLDAIVRDGDRRLRRRRLTVVGGVAVALVAAAGITALAWDRPSSTLTVADDAATKPLSYAVGSVIHSGTDTIDVGVRVDSFVPTADGFVLSDPRGQVYAEHDRELQKIGQLASRRTRLVADDAGSTVAWIDGNAIEVLSTGQNQPTAVPVKAGNAENSPVVQAVDDGTVWYWDGTQMSYDVAAGTTNRVGGVFLQSTLQSVSAGKMLVSIDAGNGSSEMQVVPVGGAPRGVGRVPDIGSGTLSPDAAHWLTDTNDLARVYDSVSGVGADLPHPGFQFAAPYTWLDDDTLAMLALPKATNDPAQPISLLTCHVSTDQCTVAARDIGTADQIALPVGLSLAAQ